ncbi:NUDIX hydrolase [Pseudoalteromonas sp. SSDWG2]|uniref:NUDIX hydrolase n=1 Tax=Pseudoalteromonas sp. SSDWG2 TaxID=3139391 RepID=UPI003BAC661C
MTTLSCAHIISRFSLSAPTEISTYRHPKRQSAVMMLLSDSPQGAQVLLCKRASHLRHHPSQLCFAGGKQEREDKSLKHTALRELHEELNIPSNKVDVIGRLPQISTLGDVVITPYLGYLQPNTRWQIDQNEVETAFFVPLSTLCLQSNWHTLSVARAKRTLNFKVLNTPHGLLWGATERIIHQFISHHGLIS